jgi:hypothetical protein
MQLDQMTGGREPQARACVHARAGRVRLPEPLEHERDERRVHADARFSRTQRVVTAVMMSVASTIT